MGSSVLASLKVVLEARARLTPRERDALEAWLAGWRDHWPSSWEREGLALEVAGSGLRLGPDPADPGRFVKLRRIALEGLARWL